MISDVERKVRCRNESGQAVLMMVVLCAGILIAFAGLAVDTGTLFQAKRRVQTVADSAAIAGATRLHYPGIANAAITNAAQADAVLNGMTSGSNGATVAVNPNYAANLVEVIATQTSPVFFMAPFLTTNPPSVSARAVGGLGVSQECIVALGTSGSVISTTGSVTAPTCLMMANADMTVTGSIAASGGAVGVVGTCSGCNNVNPIPVTGVAPISDPLAYLTPPSAPSSCTGGLSSSSGSPLNPGLYCGGIKITSSSSVTFNPGVYILNGDLDISGSPTINGTGVTFYLYGTAAIKITGSPIWNLSAPTSGILFYQDPNDLQGASFNGSSGGTLSGIFYLPAASLSFGGNSGATFNTSIVASSVSLSGTLNLTSYATVNPSTPITSAVLVE